jgi:hypothetical protein
MARASKYDRGDFMDSMLRNSGTKDGLTHEELVANANVLIIAGSDGNIGLGLHDGTNFGGYFRESVGAF